MMDERTEGRSDELPIEGHVDCPWTSYSEVVRWGRHHGLPWCIHGNEFGLTAYVRAPGNVCASLDLEVSVHGGLTAHDGQWVGFDTAHAGDWWRRSHLSDLNIEPGPAFDLLTEMMSSLRQGSPAWTVNDVQAEVVQLADQIHDLSQLDSGGSAQ
ncbi:hypothetical protein [Nocardia sp. NPDC050435]|uniref:hypothetical protein n=1 Tax=Nocardia sp. NPDC050435 TaxID=3155040 RepID=UPI00341034B4